MYCLGFDFVVLCVWYVCLCNYFGVCELNLISYFVCVDECNYLFIEQQLESFFGLFDLDFDQCSLVNLVVVLIILVVYMDWLWLGIMFYGLILLVDLSVVELGLRLVMSLGVQLILLCEVVVGESVGYGVIWIVEWLVWIGMVSCGYVDGYLCIVLVGILVLVGGCCVILVGWVLMDMLVVDFFDLLEVCVGDLVELWGVGLLVDEVVCVCGIFGYEFLSKVMVWVL